MSYTTITSSGVITNYHYDNSEFYTTKSSDEVILFENKDSKRMTVNACTFSSDATDLKISFIRTKNIDSEEIGYESDIIFIRASSHLQSDGKSINGIRVHGIAGQKIKWIGDFY